MKHIKSHFELTKGQRNGILFLLGIVVVVQIFILILNSGTSENYVEDEELSLLERQIDSINKVQHEKFPRSQIQPFNPNFLTDYRGYVLGMKPSEIDKVLEYRKSGKWINSFVEFQNISGISDSLMASVTPYLKFPEWVSNQMEGKDESSSRNKPYLKKKLDLNTASPQELKMVNGVGDVLAERIIKYRNSLNGGFASFVELENVYGLQPEVITRISDNFQIQNPRYIQQVNLNSADREELVSIPHIDYEVAHNIIEYRTLHEGFRSLEELKSVKGFPINKFKQIELYLQLN